jgi:transcriptional regulator of acetoin/glycerol metabolism
MDQVRLPLSRAEHSATTRAWERFVTGDSFPRQTVHAPIIASWQRSADCGVYPEAWPSQPAARSRRCWLARGPRSGRRQREPLGISRSTLYRKGRRYGLDAIIKP